MANLSLLTITGQTSSRKPSLTVSLSSDARHSSSLTVKALSSWVCGSESSSVQGVSPLLCSAGLCTPEY